MSKGRDWGKDRKRRLQERAVKAQRDQDAYFRDLEAARAAVGPPPPSKADLREEGATAAAAYLAKGGKIKASAPPWEESAGWSAWREVTPNERTPLLGDQFTPTRKGFMWERSKGRDLSKSP